MKTLALIVCLISSAAFGQAKFTAWAANPADPRLAEYNKLEVEQLIMSLPAVPKDKIMLKDGKTSVPLTHVASLTPAGLRYIGDAGMVLAPFDQLPAEIAKATGWQPEMAGKYVNDRKQQGLVANAAREAQNAALSAGANAREAQAAGERAGSRDVVPRMRRSSDGDDDAGPSVPWTGPVPEGWPDSESIRALLANIKGGAIKKWPKDYEMQEYEIREQCEAFRKCSKFSLGYEGVPDDVREEIIREARVKWVDDFRMQIYEMKKQGDAWLKVNR